MFEIGRRCLIDGGGDKVMIIIIITMRGLLSVPLTIIIIITIIIATSEVLLRRFQNTISLISVMRVVSTVIIRPMIIMLKCRK